MAGFVDKFKRMWDAPDDEYEYDEYGYADEGAEEDYKEEPVRNTKKERDLGGGNKVVNINATTNLQVGLFKPERFGEETRTIADELMKAHTVVLNLEDTNKDMARRILDFLSGVAYANRGKIKRVATNTYIIIPSNVDLTGDDYLMSLRTTVFTSDDDKQLIARLNNGIDLCLTRQKPYFMPFMSERKQALLVSKLKKAYFDNYLFFGGYDDSERKMLGLFFDEPSTSMFPICGIEFSFRKCDRLTHRDFLGSLMSLGIERETVGDILVEDGRAVVFVKAELSDYVKSQISKVGRVGVKVDDADLSKLPQGRGVEEKTFIVSSLRLDNIVAAVCKLSREKTKTVIMSDSVCVNFEETKNVSFNLKENDVFTIRGKGKFVLKGILGTTGKGRMRISVIHYK